MKRNIKPGDRVRIYRTEKVGEGEKRERVVYKTWKVVKAYPYFVLFVDRYGIRERFSYWYLRRHMQPPKERVDAVGNKHWDWL